MITEAYDDGWTPLGDERFGPDWHSIQALAELCDESTRLADAAEACRVPPQRTGREDAHEYRSRQDGRLAAALALFSNPHTPAETLVGVPSDDELAGLPNPSDELRKHVRLLRGPAKQRVAVMATLLRSRFTTPDILRELRAHGAREQEADVRRRGWTSS